MEGVRWECLPDNNYYLPVSHRALVRTEKSGKREQNMKEEVGKHDKSGKLRRKVLNE
jgi:hypothetical protein